MIHKFRFVHSSVAVVVVGFGLSSSADVRVWTGLGADGKASTAANWQNETCPQAGDQIKILHTAADKAIVWDLAGTFGDWTLEDYTNSLSADVALSLGSLTVGSAAQKTTLSFSQPVIVAGDLTLKSGGVLTHPKNEAEQTFQLDLTVQGDCSIEEGAAIDVSTRGTKFLFERGHNLVHGGRTFTRQGGVITELTEPCFGSAYYPIACGSGYTSNAKTSRGGGAVKLTVSGVLTLRGTIEASGNLSGWNWDSGAGGSVWITASSLAGSGDIWACGGAKGWAGCGTKGEMRFHNDVMGVGAGGRIAVHLTDPEADFSSYTGNLHAYGFGTSTEFAGAGTIYLKTGAQKVSEGMLIIDNEITSGNTRATEIGAEAGDCEFGTIIIRNGGKLSVRDGKTLKVAGDWLNAGTFMAEPGTTVQFVGATPAVILNSNAFASLVCTEPGKTLRFESGSTTSVAAGELFKVEGDAGAHVQLLSTDAGQVWNLALDASSKRAVSFVDVRDSAACVGTDGEIEGVGGSATDSTGWRFVNVSPGETIAWTGDAGSSDWGTPGNWDLGRVPASTDKVVISAAAKAAVLMTDVAVSALTVDAGATLDLAGFSLDVKGPIAVNGALKTVGNPHIVATGVASFSGVVSAAQSVLHLRGDTLVTVPTARFNAVSVESADLAVSGTLVCHELSVGDGASAQTVSFADGAKVETDILTALGSPTDKNVRLTSDGTWLLKAMKSTVSGVTVVGSDATLGLPIMPKDSTDGGRNANWLFNDTRLYWDGVSVLSETDDVVITNGISGEINAETTVRSLSLDGGSLTVSGKLTVERFVSVGNGSTLTWNVPGQIGEDLSVLAGGIVTHTGNTKGTDTYALDLQIGRNCYVAAGGAIDVTYKGYVSYTCSLGSPWYCARHASVSLGDEQCYGSVLSPTKSGSGVFSGSRGGGIVGLACDGSLTVYGAILANGEDCSWGPSGAGGSIRLSATALSGTGEILAHGGLTNSQYPGGAGRIAIRIKEATSLSSFGGAIGASGGYDNKGAYASAGTLYVETAADRENGGVVTIENPASAVSLKDGQTDLPATQAAGDADELKLTKLVIGHMSRVRLTRDLVIRDLEMVDPAATLDLNDHTLVVKSFKHKLTGTVEAGTSGTGKIVWRLGLQVFVR